MKNPLIEKVITFCKSNNKGKFIPKKNYDFLVLNSRLTTDLSDTRASCSCRPSVCQSCWGRDRTPGSRRPCRRAPSSSRPAWRSPLPTRRRCWRQSPGVPGSRGSRHRWGYLEHREIKNIGNHPGRSKLWSWSWSSELFIQQILFTVILVDTKLETQFVHIVG